VGECVRASGLRCDTAVRLGSGVAGDESWDVEDLDCGDDHAADSGCAVTCTRTRVKRREPSQAAHRSQPLVAPKRCKSMYGDWCELGGCAGHGRGERLRLDRGMVWCDGADCPLTSRA
jgi:hypothetical protein